VPSSMIFVGLVVLWLLILVPAVARHRQEVARPSATALAGRVLERSPSRGVEPQAGRDVEVDVRHEREPARAVATRPGHEDRPRVPEPRRERAEPLDGWSWNTGEDEPAPPRRTDGYRPGRGGYNPEAAALTARARYAFRQRVVLVLLILAVGSAVAAAFTMRQLWWVHGGIDLLLVGYLVYLRRQVRVEEAIRRRRAARAQGSRRAAATGDDPGRRPVPPTGDTADHLDDDRDLDEDESGNDPDQRDVAVDGAPEAAATPRRSTDPATAAPRDVDEAVDEKPALPRLKPMPPPPVPIGTTLVETTDDDPALHELESLARPDYRRASGQ
jgi:hypothetical protein